jgi:long-chain acyl-CoA synthetase
VLHAHPDVAEVVVAGVTDPILGEAVSALVVSRNADLTSQDLIRYCARNLEDFMVPKFLKFVDSLPQTETGKVSRKLAAGILEAAG